MIIFILMNNSNNIDKIKQFLIDYNIIYEYIEEITSIKYTTINNIQKEIVLLTPIFSFEDHNKNKVEIRYIESKNFRLDYHKRWGDDFWGIPRKYFAEISQKKQKENIRVIWIKDYEMNEHADVLGPDNILRKNYHRKWEVLKSYILTSAGKVQNRIYARDCEVRVVTTTGPKNEATPFLETYCFYGNRNASVTLGLYLKKDKGTFKKDTLLFLTSFGLNFYGNKNKNDENVTTEVIRVGTICNTQVIGGASKILKHFILNYPNITVNRKGIKVDIPVNKIVFYVDADHNDGRSMKSVGYTFESWDPTGGFHNFSINDINIPGLKVSGGNVFHRKPLLHKEIMQLMQNGDVISIGHAGTIVYSIDRQEYIKNNIKQ